jgi:peptide chain release factor 1
VWIQKLASLALRHQELEAYLAEPEVGKDASRLRKYTQEHAALSELVGTYEKWKTLTQSIEDTRALLEAADGELEGLARLELKTLEEEKETLEKTLQVLLLPQDPDDDRNVVLEIRAGAGGQEAALFVAEMFRAYQRFAERKGFKVSVLSTNPTGLGGFKEIIAEVLGPKAYRTFKFEGGVHRVQRVPETEAQGRVHTSTVTVAILPEAEEMDFEIQATDLRIDVFRSGGAGGQGVNTTDSAVRITHQPSGLVVVCQDERSQLKNKDKAMKILRSRLLDLEKEKANRAESATRKGMVGTGDRSEKIRTYNFPQGRLTDHRIKLTLYQLPEIMDGALDGIIEALQAHHQLEALHASS